MDANYEKAKKRVKAKKEFYKHLTSYLVMGFFFFLLNAVTAWGAWWFYWPLLGWGIGIMFHYFDVFGLPGMGTADEAWEEKAIEKELRKLGGPSQTPLPEKEEPLDLPDLRESTVDRPWRDDELV